MRRISFGRHRANCKVCSHSQRAAIEEAYCEWESPDAIAKRFHLGSKFSVYRHAAALGLNAHRSTNLRSALERFIAENFDTVRPTAASVISACHLLARINKNGEWVPDPSDNTLDMLFGRMSKTELEEYASRGVLPTWFSGGLDDPSKAN